MKKIKIQKVFGIFVALLLSLFGVVKAEPGNLDKIVAVVNRGVITQNSLDKKMAMLKRQLGDDNSISAAELRQKALNELIDNTLQIQLASRNKITITDKELDEIIAKNILKPHNLTLEQLKEVLPKQEGVSYSEFRRQLREQGMITRVQQHYLAREISITKKDIDDVLRNPPKMGNGGMQYHVYDILFETPDNATATQKEATQKVAEKIKPKFEKGAAETVVKESQDAYKDQAIKGEDLGFRQNNELPEIFAKEIINMKPGQVMGPVNAPNGLHLLKLLAVHGAPSPKLTRNQATEIAIHKKLAEKLKPWLKELKEDAYIKIMQ